MSQVMNRSAPTFGGAIGYFAITMWAVPKGHLDPQFIAEGVVMAGIICTHLFMETKAVLHWFGSLFKKEKPKEE